ncbi:hypothetical protein N8743_03735, partial [Candidatus Pelagibacter ubique]|nr:hypothetical protein [Candidatus Pelagibacter ubique]
MNILKLNYKIRFLVGIIVGIIGLYYFSYNKSDNINFEELLLSKDATYRYGQLDNNKIHCQDLRNIDECLLGYFKHGNNLPVTLWLGNSQLNVITDPKTGDKLSSETLHKLLKKKGQYLITLSQPNANLQEHFILALHLIQKLPIENIILPVVFDDLRENKIRNGIENIFNDHISKNFIAGSSATGKRLYDNYLRNNNNKDNFKDIKTHLLKDTKTHLLKDIKTHLLQENTEKYLNKNLEEIWTLWSIRHDLRGRFIIFLHKLRNYVFNIDASSKRKMLPFHYMNNFLAIEDLMKVLNNKRIKTLIYIAPIRDDYKIPYNLNEYNKFKKDLEYLSKKNNIKFTNLEHIIPGFLWGKKTSISFDKKAEL